MDKALVIVESPAKAKTIEKYLGKGYQVLASKGHVVDLPKSGIAVDVEAGYKPDYAIMPGKKKVLSELKKSLKDKQELIIAVDPDREGEAIGWHVANQLGLISLDGKVKTGKGKPTLKRIVFTEITKEAVQRALQNPRELDFDLLRAQEARRVLDRLVGYKLSPLLWKKIRYGLSAGRVQSVALRLIVEREEERDRFQPEEYWKVFVYTPTESIDSISRLVNKKPELVIYPSDAEIKKPEQTQIGFELSKVKGKKFKTNNELNLNEILTGVNSSAMEVVSLEEKRSKRYPKPPFTTSTMQQAASNALGFSAKKTMTVAQKLYERGFITYMRTDSTNMAQSAIEQSRKFIKSKFGTKFLPEKPNYYKTKAKVAQEAHEAIRPSNFGADVAKMKLESDAERLYRLIWKRALASQMTPAEVENVTLVAHFVGNQELEFRATGQKIIFSGYLEIYSESVNETILPDLKKGDHLLVENFLATQHFTKPSARFSEATLIKELEKYGIGRPSTYAPTISTIQSRKYVEKEGKYLFPTDNGVVVTKLLRDHFPEIVDLDFTARMEDDLDIIANGKLDSIKFLDEFYSPFAKKLAEKDKKIEKDDYTVLADAPDDIICPECGSKMIVKLSKFGKFYSCSKFPDCKGTLNMDGTSESDLQEKAKTDDFIATYKPAPQTDDRRDYLLKKGRFGEFWAHPDYPKVKDAQSLEYTADKLKELYGEAPQTEDGRDFLFRTGRFGKFWAHPDYPKVKKTIPIKKAKKA